MKDSQMRHEFKILVVLTSLYATCLLGAQSGPQRTESVVERARQAASEGKIAYKLTTPSQIVELWTATATETDVGRVVNPPKFIEAVQSRQNRRKP